MPRTASDILAEQKYCDDECKLFEEFAQALIGKPLDLFTPAEMARAIRKYGHMPAACLLCNCRSHGNRCFKWLELCISAIEGGPNGRRIVTDQAGEQG